MGLTASAHLVVAGINGCVGLDVACLKRAAFSSLRVSEKRQEKGGAALLVVDYGWRAVTTLGTMNL